MCSDKLNCDLPECSFSLNQDVPLVADDCIADMSSNRLFGRLRCICVYVRRCVRICSRLCFQSDAITNLTVQVEYVTNSAWTTGTSLAVAFSQWNSSKYLATKMAVDHSEDHLIHPQWDSTSPYTTNVTEGDPALLATEFVFGEYDTSMFW